MRQTSAQMHVDGIAASAPKAARHAGVQPVALGANAPRYASIDLLKASGIIVVIWIHAFQQFWKPEPLIIQRLGFVTRFAVPAFFFASGFLYAYGRPMSAREFTSRRLVRIVVPYLVASVLAIGFRHFVFSERVTASQSLFELATGGAWGIYYFVPVLLGAAIVSQGVFRFPRLAWPLFLTFLVLGLLSEMWLIPFGGVYAQARSPFRWWGYFFAGWVAAQYVASLQRLAPAQRRLIGLVALMMAATAFVYYVLALPPSWNREVAVFQYVAIYGIIVGIFLLALDSREVPIIRWLSEATYPIYLYHFFAVAAVHRWVAGAACGPVAFVLGCTLSIGGVAIARRVLVRQARLLIG